MKAAHTIDSGFIEGILDTIPQIRQALEASTSSTAVSWSDFKPPKSTDVHAAARMREIADGF